MASVHTNMKTASINKDTSISRVQINGEHFFRISNHDEMRPFFMSIVSDSNHWMFISSNGGLTAGRKNSDYSLFPYYTDDKITEATETTGSKSIFRVETNEGPKIWEPFSVRFEGLYETTRNLYKNIYGNKVLFEEINHDLKLVFRYQWNSSDTFGFVRKSQLINQSDRAVQVSILDGIQNVVPAGVGEDLQNKSSNLVDAYKRTELDAGSGLGIFALSAIIVDKAEPSEALKANIAWSIGLDQPTHLLSSLQLKNFRQGKEVQEEVDVKAEKGAYFVNTTLSLPPQGEKGWMILADLNKNHAAIADLIHQIKSDSNLAEAVNKDIEQGTQLLIQLNAGSDALQLTKDSFRDTRHFSNSLFNIMRGGIFDSNYQIEKWDFKNYLEKSNVDSFASNKSAIDALPETFSLFDLRELAQQTDDKHFQRLCNEYLPLKFSRRHGDPSRPWNKFSINTRNEIDGSKILDYEGNWRDIFQNWEALAKSYPEFIENMIHKFLNATTFDGYNPYRVTKLGFDWETIEPDNPWSYIGYWGDHQIIYLQKFLEIIEDQKPGKLASYFHESSFVYANVPYRIKGHEDILQNPKDTIEFDEPSDLRIRQKREELGVDGALLEDQSGSIYNVNFIEKILATLLAKLSNFIPEGGIWMNTQRPEWNDANNALVGNGTSMVTLYYIRRFLIFFQKQFEQSNLDSVELSAELKACFDRIHQSFEEHTDWLSGSINDKQRKTILDQLGQAGSDYRNQIYDHAFSGRKTTISLAELQEFTKLSLQYVEHTIRANKRSDDLYHAYNLMTVENDQEVSISYLSEMLEGQVAVLSSGYLSSKEALLVLDGMKKSKLFREDQYSYLLYPNKELAKFQVKNTIPEASISNSSLLSQLLANSDVRIVEKDRNGVSHFNGNFKNGNDLKAALDQLEIGTDAEKKQVLRIFEEVFNHKAFTGRSGTFYGYEGLGSIYWHMVSKLQLAVMEVCIKAVKEQESAETIGRLLEHYYEINEGIGVHKPPTLYGAFPTDPYSHTPGGKGAQQPGMTGQVKEDILSRFGELGVFVESGKLTFNPCLLRKDEFISETRSFQFIDVNQKQHVLTLEPGSLCFTYCQVPIVYHVSDKDQLEVVFNNHTTQSFDQLNLDQETSQKIFERRGEITQIRVMLNQNKLR